MAPLYLKENLYGFRYITERFMKKPFFLGVNGLSGEPVEGKPWKLHSNPALCASEVCKSRNLEDIVIFFLHVRRHNYKRRHLSTENFELVQDVISKIFEKIRKEIVPGDIIPLDTMMAAHNLITLFSDVVILSYSILKSSRFEEILGRNLLTTITFLHKLETFYLDIRRRRNSPLDTVIASCKNLKHYLKYGLAILEHYNSEKSITRITTDTREAKFTSSTTWDRTDDPFFEEIMSEVKFNEEDVGIIEYFNSITINFTKLNKEVSDRATDLHTFHSLTENSIINSQTLDNYNELRKQCDDESSSSSDEYMDKFIYIVHDFSNKFSQKRPRIGEPKSYILFQPEETYFIFLFTTLVLKYLKLVSKNHSKYEKVFRQTLTEFGNILNSIRFSEIDQVITTKDSAILSKTLEELITDPSVQNFVNGTPAMIMLVTTQICHFLGLIRSKVSYVSRMKEYRFPCFTLTRVKPIEHLEDISKIRLTKWKAYLSRNDDGKMNFFNLDECPICRCDLKEDDCCYFFCRHTLCSSCAETLITRYNT